MFYTDIDIFCLFETDIDTNTNIVIFCETDNDNVCLFVAVNDTDTGIVCLFDTEIALFLSLTLSLTLFVCFTLTLMMMVLLLTQDPNTSSQTVHCINWLNTSDVCHEWTYTRPTGQKLESYTFLEPPQCPTIREGVKKSVSFLAVLSLRC